VKAYVGIALAAFIAVASFTLPANAGRGPLVLTKQNVYEAMNRENFWVVGEVRNAGKKKRTPMLVVTIYNKDREFFRTAPMDYLLRESVGGEIPPGARIPFNNAIQIRPEDAFVTLRLIDRETSEEIAEETKLIPIKLQLPPSPEPTSSPESPDAG
jgi:hypothetical protein